MSNSKDSGLDVAVVGGSLGGLFAAIALERAGCRISVYEQSSGSMSSRGGGIVIQRELTEFFARYNDGDSLLPQTRCSARRIFNPDGSIRSDDGPAQTFTSWDAIFRKLKGTKLEGSYNTGRRVTEYHSENDRPSFELDDGSVVESELIVCSDGSDSTARIQLCPLAGNSYAGYVAWRGYVDESQLPPEVLTPLMTGFVFSTSLTVTSSLIPSLVVMEERPQENEDSTGFGT